MSFYLQGQGSDKGQDIVIPGGTPERDLHQIRNATRLTALTSFMGLAQNIQFRKMEIDKLRQQDRAAQLREISETLLDSLKGLQSNATDMMEFIDGEIMTPNFSPSREINQLIISEFNLLGESYAKYDKKLRAAISSLVENGDIETALDMFNYSLKSQTELFIQQANLFVSKTAYYKDFVEYHANSKENFEILNPTKIYLDESDYWPRLPVEADIFDTLLDEYNVQVTEYDKLIDQLPNLWYSWTQEAADLWSQNFNLICRTSLQIQRKMTSLIADCKRKADKLWEIDQTVQASPESNVHENNGDMKTKLRNLNEMLSEGLITEDEFADMRKSILDTFN